LIQSASRNAGDVLSEGEYRCVALAGFMAELATNNSHSGIIFDDPVSSLDHLHREAIAKRLAEEGRSRQVIVFTHDLPFLFLLRNACAQVDDPTQKTEVALRHIQKRQKTPGHCRNEPPEKAQDAAMRLKAIRTHLGNTRIQYEQDPDGTTWLITARGLIDSLRQTWETAVEDAVSPVLRTFSSKVDTKGFAKLSAIQQQDAETMRKHYGQCSEMLHKTSDAMNPVAPTPDDITSETEALEKWLSAVTERQQKIK
jgi:energy-coupling factor transporter ATP-binding protein EcfA2